MGRIRTVKPEFFDHEGLYELEVETSLPVRLAFIGLWTQADRDGRFKWRPVRLKIRILPYDEVDFSRVLDALVTRGFVVRYASNGVEYGHIPTWHDHQSINNREAQSEIPEPLEIIDEVDASSTRRPRVMDLHKGKGRERKGKERKESCAPDGFPGLLTKKGRRLARQELYEFTEFWEAFDYKRGKREAADAWLNLKVTDEMFPKIIAGALRAAKTRPAQLGAGSTPKMAEGWLSGYRWEDADVEIKTGPELPEFQPRKQA